MPVNVSKNKDKLKNDSKTSFQKNHSGKGSDEIEEWLVNAIAGALEIDIDEIDTGTPFERFGLDSVAVIGLTGELGEWLDQQVEPSLLYDYPTINALVKYLSERRFSSKVDL